MRSTDPASRVREGNWYGGTVVSVSPQSPETFPTSKWECLEVAWDADKSKSEISRVCPWESREYIYPPPQYGSSVPTDECHEGTAFTWLDVL